MKLFDADIKGLENAEPLYSQDMFVYFDRYNDGDPYNDERYIRNFKTVLKALRENVKQSLNSEAEQVKCIINR